MNSYPGGKSGAGVFQRLINLIPPHDVLVVPFAGHCGVVQNIRPADQTIVIDRDERVCHWWDTWRRSRRGRSIEIHHGDGIEFLRYRFDATAFRARGPGPARCSAAATPKAASKYSNVFVFCDPPYVMTSRSGGAIYRYEMNLNQHADLLAVVNAISVNVMLCGLPSALYADRLKWPSVPNRVPTRRGIQNELVWMNYQIGDRLHDHQYLGSCRRSRERIRRRQANWRKQLEQMTPHECAAMLDVLNGVNQ